MRRVVSLWFPHLATDRLRRRAACGLGRAIPDGPLVTSSHDGRKLVVAGVDAEARRLGLFAGLPIGEAQARIAGLVVVPGDAGRDAAELVRLARLCVRFAPLAAAAPPDGVMVDVTGCAHLFGGERRLLARMVARFAELGLACRAAIAGTPGAAHAVARHGETGAAGTAVVRPEEEAFALAGLPPEGLRIDPALARGLRLLGLDTIGAVAKLPRGPLARRFGAELALRLDQAFGLEVEPIRPEATARPVAARLAFVEPLSTAEAFEAVAGRLLDEVCARLEAMGAGARRLELAFERVNGSEAVLRVATARAARDAGRLGRLFGERFGTVDPGAGVEAMRLSVRVWERVAAMQLGTEDGGGGRDGLAPLVDTLVNRLGAGRVWRPAPLESDVPERSAVRIAPLAVAVHGDGWPQELKRPVRLLDPPQPVEVMALLPDHPPASFIWRRMRHRVRHADGPERIGGEWWRSAAEVRALRDYFRVEDESGQRFWLFRRGDGSDPETGDMRWFVHGLF